ncbi:MAG: GDP-mannose 4,6-dehydratase [bacterium]
MENSLDTAVTSIKGKKILITGGLGFIGSNLAYKCLELGAEVSIYDCLDPHSGGNMANIKGIKNEIELIFCDILNFDQVSKHVVNKDIIFNCAASTSHPFSMREPWIDLDVNGNGVINLLEATRRFNADAKFIHIGTSTQIGKLHYSPADENHPEFPMDIYSANKCVSEKYVHIYGKAHKIPVCIIRLPNVFGPRATIKSPEFTFVNYFIGLALQDREITVFGDGKQLRNVLYIDDCVNALVMASQSSKTNGQVYFAVGDDHYSVSDIAEAIVKNIGTGTVKFIKWPGERKSIEAGDAVLSNKKIKETLHWKPQFNLENGLKSTRNFFINCLDKYLG